MHKTATRSTPCKRILSAMTIPFGLFCGLLTSPPAQAQELLVNGGFETGDFAGWTVSDFSGSVGPGSYTISNNALDSLFTPAMPSTLLQRFPSVGARSGQFYAVSDSGGPGAHVLIQDFTLAPKPKEVLLSFDMFINDWNGAGALNASGLLYPFQLEPDGILIPTQFGLVDLLAGDAPDFTDDNGVLTNFYLGESGFGSTDLPNGYQHFQFDITRFVQEGGTYRLRFGEVDNQFTLNQGIDNVSLNVTAVPEPGVGAITAGLVSVVLTGFRARKRRHGSKAPVTTN